MTSASDEKWRPVNCFFSWVGLRTYQHPCMSLLCEQFLHRAKYSAVLTLSQYACYIRLLLPQGVTEVRSFLTRLFLLWSTTLWVNSLQKSFLLKDKISYFLMLSISSLSKLRIFLMATFRLQRSFINTLTCPKSMSLTYLLHGAQSFLRS